MEVPLSELRRIMEVRRSGICNCTSLKGSIESRLTAIDQRIQELAAMRKELAELLAQWQDCGGSRQPAEALG
jgi:DNA-binding transcriptional MerR regulator